MSSIALIIGAGVGLLAINILWFLYRKIPSIVFMPLVNIVSFSPRFRPKFVAKAPLWPLFLNFLFLTLIWILIFNKPSKTIPVVQKDNDNKLLVLLDYSASVSAVVGLSEYNKKNISLISNLNPRFQAIYLAASYGYQTKKIDGDQYRKDLEEKAFFHPGDFQWTSFLKRVLQEANGEVFTDILFVSDRMDHSWGLFDPKEFSRIMNAKLWFVDASNASYSSLNNYFIKHAGSSIDQISQQRTLKAVLARSSVDQHYPNETLGVSVFFQDQEMKSYEISWSDQQREQQISLSWDISNEPQSSLPDGDGVSEISLVIDPASKRDSIALDNRIYMDANKSYGSVLILGPSKGESPLQDNGFFLKNSLESYGYKVLRRDLDGTSKEEGESFKLMIGLQGEGGRIEDYCPRSFNTLWLFPGDESSGDYEALCSCVATLTGQADKVSLLCTQIQSARSYADLLKSMGAKQLGGAIDNPDSAPAWAIAPPTLQNGNILVAFVQPPNPQLMAGGQVPFLKMMSRYLDLKNGRIGLERDRISEVSDISELDWYDIIVNNKNIAKQPQKLRVSQGESSLILKDEVFFASFKKLENHGSDTQGGMSETFKDSTSTTEDAGSYVFWILLGVLVFGFIDVFAALLYEAKLRKVKQALSSIVVMGVFAANIHAESITPVIWTSNQNSATNDISKKISIRKLSDEISSRTSLRVSETVDVFSKSDLLKAKLPAQPWLFIEYKDLQNLIKQKNNSLFTQWVRAGGFLYVHAYEKDMPSTADDLARSMIGSTQPSIKWQPIPAEHELMRSFHLLSALPSCDKFRWHYLEYDQRMLAVLSPIPILEILSDTEGVTPHTKLNCRDPLTTENLVRVFINLSMVVLATDYKKDQIHLPEILKRLQ